MNRTTFENLYILRIPLNNMHARLHKTMILINENKILQKVAVTQYAHHRKLSKGIELTKKNEVMKSCGL